MNKKLHQVAPLLVVIGGLILFFSWTVSTAMVEKAAEARRLFQNIKAQKFLHDDLAGVLTRLSDLSERMAFGKQHSAALLRQSVPSSSDATLRQPDDLDKQVRALTDQLQVRANFMENVADLQRYANEIQSLAQQVDDQRSINSSQDITKQLDGLTKRCAAIEKTYGASTVLSPSATQAQRQIFVQNAPKFLAEEWDTLGATTLNDFQTRLSEAYDDIYNLAGQELKKRENQEAFSGVISKLFYVIGTFLLICGGWLKDRDSV
jgi:hypothetical protein